MAPRKDGYEVEVGAVMSVYANANDNVLVKSFDSVELEMRIHQGRCVGCPEDDDRPQRERWILQKRQEKVG